VVELDWWQKHETGGVNFHLTPVQHWSARGLTDRNRTDEPLDQPPRDLALALAQQSATPQDFFLLKVGEIRTLPRRTPTLPPTGTIMRP